MCKRGDIYYVDFGEKAGSEQKFHIARSCRAQQKRNQEQCSCNQASRKTVQKMRQPPPGKLPDENDNTPSESITIRQRACLPVLS